MEIILICGVVVAVCFAGVLLVGAPYLPTLEPQITAAFELLKLKKGQTVLELGCGDGKVLVWAAEHGYRAVGVELNPFLVAVAWLRTRRYHGRVTVRFGNYWRMRWPESDGVFVFLLDKFMPALDKRMKSYKKPLASVAFRVPGRTQTAEKRGVFLYDYR